MKVEQLCAEAQRASRVLAGLTRAQKDEALFAVADALRRRSAEILAENDEDIRLARENKLADALVDRLLLDEDRLRDVEAAVHDVAALPDPVGQLVDGWRLDNGVELRKVRVPLGVIAVIYEARPNVTVDAAALCLKSGNAVILRGGSAALHTNRILAEVVQGAVIEVGLPREAVMYLTPDRRELAELLKQRKYVDLVVPRGSEDLKEYLLENSKVPVIYAAGGNCHVYVDAAADLDKALPIIINSKCQRPGVCNAAETLLVHEEVAAAFLPRAAEELKRRGVELVVDKAAGDAIGDPTLKRANKTHYDTEFLALKLAVHVVASVDEAIDHVNTHGTRHSEAIVTEDLAAARAFTARVDAACVYVNASTRFTDGGQFGLGAELGNSTQKLHVRGPIALQELTCVKYELWGDGQVRG
ncbi:MAG TPA: glutamate-5-semialdehyde dehydrogenase [Thermoleophilia bacterium]|nr:glutamate-5-semialdehyde dehydrogenase [Thermoleophilia bacterium]